MARIALDDEDDQLPDEEHIIPSIGKIELDGTTLDIDYFLKSSYDEISRASTELPAIIEWINEQLQSIIEEKMIVKQEIKEAEATAFFELTNGGFEDRYHGKQTATAISMAIALEPTVKKIHRRFAVLSGWASRLQSLQYSLTAKLDLVRSTESTRRKVYDAETQ